MPGSPDQARRKYARLAPSYDRGSRLRRWLTAPALENLRLQPGDTVLDVCCGTGDNLGVIERRIGPQGKLIGIDLSDQMLERAHQKVEQAGWNNVELICSDVATAEIPGNADAALFSLAHDVSQSEQAITNVVDHLNDGASVAISGAKWPPRWALPVRWLVALVARPFVTTYEGFDAPWAILARHSPDFEVRSRALGGAFVGWGTVNS